MRNGTGGWPVHVLSAGPRPNTRSHDGVETDVGDSQRLDVIGPLTQTRIRQSWLATSLYMRAFGLSRTPYEFWLVSKANTQ